MFWLNKRSWIFYITAHLSTSFCSKPQKAAVFLVFYECDLERIWFEWMNEILLDETDFGNTTTCASQTSYEQCIESGWIDGNPSMPSISSAGPHKFMRLCSCVFLCVRVYVLLQEASSQLSGSPACSQSRRTGLCKLPVSPSTATAVPTVMMLRSASPLQELIKTK